MGSRAPSVATLASAMDVGNPSNMERCAGCIPGRRRNCASQSHAPWRSTTTRSARRSAATAQELGQIWCPHTATAAARLSAAGPRAARGARGCSSRPRIPPSSTTIVEPLDRRDACRCRQRSPRCCRCRRIRNDDRCRRSMPCVPSSHERADDADSRTCRSGSGSCVGRRSARRRGVCSSRVGAAISRAPRDRQRDPLGRVRRCCKNVLLPDGHRRARSTCNYLLLTQRGLLVVDLFDVPGMIFARREDGAVVGVRSEASLHVREPAADALRPGRGRARARGRRARSTAASCSRCAASSRRAVRAPVMRLDDLQDVYPVGRQVTAVHIAAAFAPVWERIKAARAAQSAGALTRAQAARRASASAARDPRGRAPRTR